MMTTACHSVEKDPAFLAFQWEKAGELPGEDGHRSPGVAGPVAGMIGNRLVIGGGSNFPDGAPWEGGSKKYYDKVFLFEKANGKLKALSKTLSLPYQVAYPANVKIAQGLVVMGGENEDGAIDEVLLLTEKEELKSLPNLPQPLSSGMAATDGRYLFFAGGVNEKGASDRLFQLDLNHLEKEWELVSRLPHAVSHGGLFYSAWEGRESLYLIGGRKANKDSLSDFYNTVHRFDLKENVWEEKLAMPYALSAFSGLEWNDSVFLIFSGDQGTVFHKTEDLIAKIAQEKDPDISAQLIKEKNELQQSHPGFSGNVLLYEVNKNAWIRIDSIPFPGQVTTTAVKWDRDIFIPNGEIRAGVRTPDILMGKLKRDKK